MQFTIEFVFSNTSILKGKKVKKSKQKSEKISNNFINIKERKKKRKQTKMNQEVLEARKKL